MPDAAERFWTGPDGLALFARDYPPASGPARLPVICIHGLTRNSRDFDLLAPHIARTAGRRVLAVDVRGRGRSAYDPDPRRYVAPVYAGDVAALMTQAGIARAIFIGTSMGGLITLALAVLRPDLVAGAVLNDIGPEITPAGLTRIATYVGQGPPVASWAEAAAYAKRLNGAFLPALSDADWDRFARRIFREEPPGVLRLDYDPAIAQAMQPPPADKPPPAPDLWPMFAALAKDRPLLLIRGEASDILSAETAARMAGAAPAMRQLVLPGVGHAPTLDEPPSRAAIDALLAEAP